MPPTAFPVITFFTFVVIPCAPVSNFLWNKFTNLQIYSNFSGLHGKQQEMQQDIYKQ